jgi:predicted nucleic acid-binding protein
MRLAVVDTSALLRVFVPDGPMPDGLEDLLDQATRGNAVVLIPDLALAEATQVLLKKQSMGLLQADEADEILAAMLDLPYEVMPCRSLLADALDLGRKFGVTVYDGLFLALARQRRAELFTADAEMKRVWKKLQAK